MPNAPCPNHPHFAAAGSSAREASSSPVSVLKLGTLSCALGNENDPDSSCRRLTHLYDLGTRVSNKSRTNVAVLALLEIRIRADS
jgi:hypothetical protein